MAEAAEQTVLVEVDDAAGVADGHAEPTGRAELR